LRKLILTLFSVAVLLPGLAQPVGLGKIKLDSVLNEPLQAQVKLLSLKQIPLQEIQVGLGSQEEFKRVGLERPFFLTKLKFDIERLSDDTPVIHITTRAPVTDPFLSFLMYVSWSSGELYRNYTVLLDPPNYTVSTAKLVQPVQSVKPSEPQSATRAIVAAPAAPKPVAKKASSQLPQTKAVKSTEHPGFVYGPTKMTDTLLIIAKENRPDTSVTVNQTMLAILANNPNAFFGHNVNRLKAGFNLQIPGKEIIKATSPVQAMLQVHQQNIAWREHRKTTPQVAYIAPEPQKTTQSTNKTNQSANTTQSDNKTEQSTNNLNPLPNLVFKNETHSTLEESPLFQQGVDDGNEQLRMLRAELAISAEAVRASNEANKIITEQIKDLREDNKVLKQNLADKEVELVALKEQLAALTPREFVTSTGDINKDIQHIIKSMGAGQAEEADISQPMSNGIFWLAALLLLLGGTGAGVWFFRQRPRATQSSLAEPTVVREQSLLLDQESDSKVTITKRKSAPMDVDPLDEAAVFLTYDKKDKARAVLENAISNQPERVDLKFKLLEILHSLNDKPTFQAYLATLPKDFEDTDPALYELVQSMEATLGQERQISVEEHLGIGAYASNEQVESEQVEYEHSAGLETAEEKETHSTEETATEATATEETAIEETGAVVEEENEMAKSADDDVKDEAEAQTEENDEASHVLEFESGLSPKENELSIESEIVVDLDSDESCPVEDLAGEDVIATKLDLATAYMDMGDVDGAKELLGEVLTQGTEAQVEEAKQILSRTSD